MVTENKQQIVDAALDYMQDKGLTAAGLAKLSAINPSYLSTMLRGIEEIKVKDKLVAIDAKWYRKLAGTIGFKTERTFWNTLPTDQFVQIVEYLESAKERGGSGMLIGDTGVGKTYAVDRFVKKHPLHTYRITVSKLHTLHAILDQLMERLGIVRQRHSARSMDKILAHLRRLKNEGEKVIIIIDEAENLRTPVFGMVKALYDGIVDFCAIVLIGTSELTDKMERLKAKNKDGMPQFCRRFKAGTRHLNKIDKRQHFGDFFEMCGITDKGLRKLLDEMADNYGELHDYVEPALREADRQGRKLDEQLFRIIYNLPNY